MRKENEIRVSPSSPDYEEINLLTMKIAMLKNPHLFNLVDNIPHVEAQAVLMELEQELQELLDFQTLPFNKVLLGLR
jgi:hypothetical protein